MNAAIALAAVVAGILLPSGTALADDEMYKTKNCFACHRIDKDYHGPSFQRVAEKYANDKEADAQLVKKIREGSVGVWGPTPMPPQAQVTDDEALTLVRWILSLK